MLLQVALRPPLGEREQRDIVGPIVVAIEVRPARHLRRGCHPDDRDAAFDKTRHVDVPERGAAAEVAAPQQRVGVQVDDGQPAVHIESPARRVVRTGLEDAVAASFDESGRGATESGGAGQECGGGRDRPRCDRGGAGQARHR